MYRKIKSPFILSAVLCIFLSAGCSSEQKNDVIDESPQKVCGLKKYYVISNPYDCTRAKFGCGEKERLFWDSKGCGCEGPALCDEPE